MKLYDRTKNKEKYDFQSGSNTYLRQKGEKFPRKQKSHNKYIKRAGDLINQQLF